MKGKAQNQGINESFTYFYIITIIYFLHRRWEDGQKVVKQLEKPDRWEVHAAEQVLVTLGTLPPFTVVQQPTSLTAQKIGVGACLWDGAILLAAYLIAQPHYKFVGAKCIELGAGVGLVSAALASLGACVITTDIAKVLPLLEDNMVANGVLSTASSGPQGGWAEVAELEWGKEGWMQTVRLMADPPPDLVLAADCCYIDNDGVSPSTPAFVETCAGLCGPQTKVLVAFERRSSEVRRCFIEEAKKAFSYVEMIPVSQFPPSLRLEYCDIWELRL